MNLILTASLVLAAGLAGCSHGQGLPNPSAPERAARAPARPTGPAAAWKSAAVAPPTCGAPVREEILQRVNAVRASGYRCGGRSMARSAPLKWDVALQSAASTHSLDMARRNYFDHRSPDGKDVAARASAMRYPWKSVGENIAGGDRSVAEVVQSWLESPDHCENIMDPGFQDVAVACVAQPGTEYGTYWTMVLGRRRGT
jgi:uncharacterized protein YkwD